MIATVYVHLRWGKVAVGIGFLVTGLFALPPIRKTLSARLGIELTGGLAVIITIALLMITGGIDIMTDGL